MLVRPVAENHRIVCQSLYGRKAPAAADAEPKGDAAEGDAEGEEDDDDDDEASDADDGSAAAAAASSSSKYREVKSKDGTRHLLCPNIDRRCGFAVPASAHDCQRSVARELRTAHRSGATTAID